MLNTEQSIQNAIAHGLYKTDHVMAIVKEQSRSIEPSVSQVAYRDALYKFLLEKGVVREGFPLGRSKSGITSNIRAYWTLIRKHGLVDEWMGRGDHHGG